MRGVRLTGIINLDDNQRTQKPPETAFWLDHEYDSLMNTDKLSAVAQDPWQVNLQGVLSSFLHKMADYQFCNLRVGGRVLYSASYLLRRKSDIVIFDSGSTQEFIQNVQTSEPDPEDPNLENEGQNTEANGFELETGLGLPPEYGELSLETTTEGEIPAIEGNRPANQVPLESIDFHKKGAPTLKGLQRMYYKKIQLEDLAGALAQVVKRRAIGPREPKRETVLPVLPENFFERAQEERANGELLQKQIEGTINQLYQTRQQPVGFVEIIVHPDRKGIVRTLMSILHLSTKKKIEIWQASGELETQDEDQSGINIFLAPYGQFKNQTEINKE